MGSIIDHFSDLPDPRVDRTRRHNLIDILTISLCAAICGCDNFVDVADFGEAKEEWFRTFLELPNGIPSHDTFNRIFCLLDPASFTRCFIDWVAALQGANRGETNGIKGDKVLSLDGKTLRHSFDTASGQAALHMVSAWADWNALVLGQVAVDEKSNEITAVPKLLQMLDIAGCIVTADALNTQKATAQQIQSQGADYVLALKDNHPNLSADVQSYFDRCLSERWLNVEALPIPYTFHQDVDGGHGRVEIRKCWATECPNWVEGKQAWDGLQTIALIERERIVGGKTTHEHRLYLTSLEPEAKRIANAVRAHWGIENKLHWVLDVAFGEDMSRIRKDNAPNNMAILRHITLNLIKQENSGKKKSIRRKRLLAGWENDYLLKVLLGT